MSRRWNGLAYLAIALAVSGVYAGHFGNGFHFDDAHAVVENPYIRSLSYVPRMFTDATTFSTLPANRSWRPVVTASLALDYRLAGGLRPAYFQASTFLWFLAQLGLMGMLFLKLGRREAAWGAVALYGLHPAIAETVNYVIQRGDVYAALGMVAGLVGYACAPQGRRWGWYLAPVAVGVLSKPTALVFPALLFLFIWLGEDAEARRAAVGSLPALGVCAGLGIWTARMTPATFSPGASSAYAFRITQPLVMLRFFGTFFWPLHLSADTDHRAAARLLDSGVLAGFAFVALMIAAAAWCARRREWRGVAFGLSWFLVAQIPTAWFAVAEVENDHRMYLPFIGLALAAASAAELGWRRLPRRRWATATAAGLMACALAGYAQGTWRRNRVWRSEEALWRDVTEKSPGNGRGWMNYGLTQMAQGRYGRAVEDFDRAERLTPNYATLEINQGIARGGLGETAEAERHFLRARALAPGSADVYYFYGRWLGEQGRTAEAVAELRAAEAVNPDALEPRYLLLRLLAGQGRWAEVKAEAGGVLGRFPADATAQTFAAAARDRVGAAERLAQAQPTPEHFLDLSLAYHQAGRFPDCIAAARQALRLRPAYPEAYNNIAAAYEDMGNWDAAIAAAQAALRIRPGYALARNNLAWALGKKKNMP